MQGLSGRRVILTATRKASEIDLIIRKQGGVTIFHPVQLTTLSLQASFDKELTQFLNHRFDWIVLTTGIGVNLVFEGATRLGRLDELLAKFRASRLVVRGHKTTSVLKEYHLTPACVSEDGTTDGVEKELRRFDLAGCHIAFQRYGGPPPRILSWLQSQQANVFSLQPYDYVCADASVMRDLLSDVLARRADVIAFTSASQVYYLMSYAAENNQFAEVVGALSDVIPAAVGSVTAGALFEQGVAHVIVPEHERMGGMVVSMAKYFENLGPDASG